MFFRRSTALYRPWRALGRARLGERALARLAACAVILVCTTLAGVFCLKVVGAWRWTLLEHADALLAGGLALAGIAMSGGGSAHAKAPAALRRAAALGVVGLLLLLWYRPGAGGEGITVLPPPSAQWSGSMARARAAAFAEGAGVPQPLHHRARMMLELQPPVVPASASALKAAAAASAGAEEDADLGSAGGSASANGENDQAEAAAPENEEALLPAVTAAAVDGASASVSSTASAVRSLASRGRWLSRREAALAAASRVKRALEAQTVGSSYLAGAILVAVSWLNALRRRMTRSVAADTGLGTRRVLALVVTGAAAVMIPVAAIHALLDGGGGSDSNAGESLRAPSWPYFFLAAVSYGAVVCIFSDIAVELPLLSSVFGGGSGAGATSGGALSSPWAGGSTPLPIATAASASAAAASAPSGSAAAVLAQQDAAAVRCLSLLVAFGLGAALCWALGGPYGGQVTLLGLFAAGVLYVPAAISSSGLDASRALGTLRKRLGAEPAAATGGAAAMATSMLTAWFVDLSGLLAVVGHAAGLISEDDGARAALPRFASSYGATGGVAGVADRRTFGGRVRHVFEHVWNDPDSRKIFLFLTINVSLLLTRALAGLVPLYFCASRLALCNPPSPFLTPARSSYSCLWRFPLVC